MSEKKLDVLYVEWLCCSSYPIVGAVAIEYPDKSFSVFVGIAKGVIPEQDINTIVNHGCRQSERIGRGIFPQCSDMDYHH